MNNKKGFPLFLISILLLAFSLYWFGERWLKSLLLYLSTARWAQQFITHTPIAWQAASRFIAGETVDEAITAVRTVNAQGIKATVNFLGEHVHSIEEAAFARDQILQLLDQIHQTGVDANVSVKPSQLGLNIDPAVLYANLYPIIAKAQASNNFVRIDMEDHTTTDTTLAIYRRLRDDDGFGHHVGVVIQAYLYRSQADITQLAMEGGRVRLCKGAYAEATAVAFAEKSDTDANYVRLAQLMLAATTKPNGMYPAFATHDQNMIDAIRQAAQQQQVPAQAYEFQMLYGVRRNLQQELVAQGQQMRVYIPYGTAWYPYFVRRLAERPANLWFFLNSLLRG